MRSIFQLFCLCLQEKISAVSDFELVRTSSEGVDAAQGWADSRQQLHGTVSTIFGSGGFAQKSCDVSAGSAPRRLPVQFAISAEKREQGSGDIAM